MKNAFKQIPEPLQKQILLRLGGGIAMLIITMAFLYSTLDFFSVLDCTAIVLLCLISSISLFRRAIIGDYVVISGECQQVTLTAVRKRTKMITLKTDDGKTLQVMIKQRLKKVATGSRVILYVAANMPVYEKGDALLLHSYLAIRTVLVRQSEV